MEYPLYGKDLLRVFDGLEKQSENRNIKIKLLHKSTKKCTYQSILCLPDKDYFSRTDFAFILSGTHTVILCYVKGFEHKDQFFSFLSHLFLSRVILGEQISNVGVF